MANDRQFLSKLFFWSFERGSWQYDLAVIGILVFVFFMPRKWLHDQPEAAQQSQQIEMLPSSGDTRIYRVDTRVLAKPEQIPQLQSELHRAMQRAVPDLQSGRFEILNIEAERDEQGLVTAYKVSIRRK